MKTCVVTFEPGHICVPTEKGTTLLQAQIMAGLRPDAPCGGRGSCGKCRVLTDAREVLACRTAVERDVTVLLPEKAEAVILTADSGQTVEADGESKYA